MPLKGVDVSQWQGDINFDTLKDNVDFFICKVSEGVGFTDPKFARNQSECRRVGLPLGYYHFARPNLGNSAKSEADYFLKTIGELRDGEILFLDFEVPYRDPVTWCKDFLDSLSKSLNGYKPLIYLNQSQVKGYNWKPIIDANYGLWLAAYLSTTPSTPWSTVAFQQNSSSGSIKGINGKVDTNLFFGDKKALVKYGVSVENPATGQLEALQVKLDDMRASRDEWKKVASDYKKQIEDLEAKVTELTNQVDALQKVVQSNKTPLTEYGFWEKVKSLFS